MFHAISLNVTIQILQWFFVKSILLRVNLIVQVFVYKCYNKGILKLNFLKMIIDVANILFPIFYMVLHHVLSDNCLHCSTI